MDSFQNSINENYSKPLFFQHLEALEIYCEVNPWLLCVNP